MLNGVDSLAATYLYADHELIGLHLFDSLEVFKELQVMVRASDIFEQLRIVATPMDVSHFSKNRLACIIMVGIYYAESYGYDGVIVGVTPEFGFTKLLALQRVLEINGSNVVLLAPLISKPENDIKKIRALINL